MLTYFFISLQEPFKEFNFCLENASIHDHKNYNLAAQKYTKKNTYIRVLKLVIFSDPQEVAINWDSPWCNYGEQIIWCCNKWEKVTHLIPVEGNGGHSQPSTDKTLDHLSLAHQLLGWLRMSRHHIWRKREGKKKNKNFRSARESSYKRYHT